MTICFSISHLIVINNPNLKNFPNIFQLVTTLLAISIAINVALIVSLLATIGGN